ncbi:hypothetical protein GIS00_18425 [Nakamurella sp. YIM 132087]|uniref:PspA domain-containing protein n=1 Tax=Nakamurella alba TaxID=2665158 RepID=A0A7K1FSW4_9ACTN|nr:hypothetical protein [Nakamurella alba]MTD15914.1 hypothetical protein [Nakamurella alba]
MAEQTPGAPDDVTDAELVDETPAPTPDHSDNSDDDSSEDVQDAELVEPAAIVPAPFVPGSTPDLTLPPPPAFDYTDAGVPTLDYVRSKVEGRLGTAMGAEELARAAAKADEVEKARAEQEAERARLAAEKLAEIRRSLGQG